jgi:hypothetical protein
MIAASADMIAASKRSRRNREMWIRSWLPAVCAIVLVVGCGGGSECKVEDVKYTKSLNAVGFGGETQGVNVARFDLTQDFISHTPYTACAQGPLQDVGNVSLTITSLAPKPIFLKYDVQGLNTDGIPVWSHADTLGITIAPSQTVSVGQIVTSPQQLGDGGARVSLQAAEYVP